MSYLPPLDFKGRWQKKAEKCQHTRPFNQGCTTRGYQRLFSNSPYESPNRTKAGKFQQYPKYVQNKSDICKTDSTVYVLFGTAITLSYPESQLSQIALISSTLTLERTYLHQNFRWRLVAIQFHGGSSISPRTLCTATLLLNMPTTSIITLPSLEAAAVTNLVPPPSNIALPGAGPPTGRTPQRPNQSGTQEGGSRGLREGKARGNRLALGSTDYRISFRAYSSAADLTQGARA